MTGPGLAASNPRALYPLSVHLSHPTGQRQAGFHASIPCMRSIPCMELRMYVRALRAGGLACSRAERTNQRSRSGSFLLQASLSRESYYIVLQALPRYFFLSFYPRPPSSASDANTESIGIVGIVRRLLCKKERQKGRNPPDVRS